MKKITLLRLSQILKVRNVAGQETKPRSWCRYCASVTLTEKVDVCRMCYPHGGKTAVCHKCNKCKACGKDPDVSKGYELFESDQPTYGPDGHPMGI